MKALSRNYSYAMVYRQQLLSTRNFDSGQMTRTTRNMELNSPKFTTRINLRSIVYAKEIGYIELSRNSLNQVFIDGLLYVTQRYIAAKDVVATAINMTTRISISSWCRCKGIGYHLQSFEFKTFPSVPRNIRLYYHGARYTQQAIALEAGSTSIAKNMSGQRVF